MLIAFLAVVAILAAYLLWGSGTNPSSSTTSVATGWGSHPATIPAVESGLLPWSLPKEISRENVIAGPGNTVTLLGGLNSSSASTPTVESLDTSSGTISPVGTLPAGIHDAAAASIGNAVYQFGGGAPTTGAGIEAITGIPMPAPPPPPSIHTGRRSTTTTSISPIASPFAASSAGELPTPRSDSVAVTIGNTVYIVGGYDGTNPAPQVLATTDGTHFTNVVSLAQAVRYPAVAASGPTIYLFGGEITGGSSTGQLTDDIQAVDTQRHTARVVGHLPQALGGASAFALNGNVYVAGGVTSPIPSSQMGSGGGPAAASSTADVATVYAFDPSTSRVLVAGTLPRAIAYAGSEVVGSRAWMIGGEVNGNPVASVEMITPNAAFGSSGQVGAGSPYFGAQLLIADRGNNRLLLLDDTGKIVWTYPSANAPAPPGGFYFPDDAFFAKNGTEIISNQEENDTIVIIGFPSGRVIWQYGHPRSPGAAPGYLHEPDDAYLLKNGQVTTADADNCRVVFINPDQTVAAQVGTSGVCVHNPPTEMVSPNGDTPLSDGNFLVSEISGSIVDEYTELGSLVWSEHLPIGYPSDPQQMGPDLYLISDYSHPGAIEEFNREGQILYKYQPSSGSGELNQPSLTELLPSGVFMTNDDYRDRMVAIDPTTQALVWQYGVTDTAGTAPGELSIPDGFDLLMPDGSTPTHPYTG